MSLLSFWINFMHHYNAIIGTVYNKLFKNPFWFSLRGNSIGMEGAKAFSSALKKNRSLRSLKYVYSTQHIILLYNHILWSKHNWEMLLKLFHHKMDVSFAEMWLESSNQFWTFAKCMYKKNIYFLREYILNCNLLLWSKLNFSVFSVSWPFRNHSNMLICWSSNISFFFFFFLACQ